jgi:hypothetical protein
MEKYNDGRIIEHLSNHVITSKCLSNTFSLNIYEDYEINETVAVAGFSNEFPQLHIIKYGVHEDEEEMEYGEEGYEEQEMLEYIEIGECKYYLRDFI